ncbi:MAG: cadherin-like domain-containing protein [Gammaproteobacteria bacterium]|nr:cadherin-like domain-containing protein [Gammaproteobacteria bacterium]
MSNGTLALNGDGTFDYTPDADFNGADSFTYDVEDVNGDTETVAVDITVSPVADGVADSFTTDEDTALSDDVSTNDTFSAAANYQPKC